MRQINILLSLYAHCAIYNFKSSAWLQSSHRSGKQTFLYAPNYHRPSGRTCQQDTAQICQYRLLHGGTVSQGHVAHPGQKLTARRHSTGYKRSARTRVAHGVLDGMAGADSQPRKAARGARLRVPVRLLEVALATVHEQQLRRQVVRRGRAHRGRGRGLLLRVALERQVPDGCGAVGGRRRQHRALRGAPLHRGHGAPVGSGRLVSTPRVPGQSPGLLPPGLPSGTCARTTTEPLPDVVMQERSHVEQQKGRAT